MKISLIGMSGAGKTFWASKLEKTKGFKKYSCDDFIEKELTPKLRQLGYKGINGLAQWMGQPYDKSYKINSRQYLELEAESLNYILNKIKKSKKNNIVVDTTGSVILMPAKLLAALKKQTKVIYLETSQADIQKMFKQYLADPKPVIWGSKYKPLAGEKKDEALKRCYPQLLKYRKKLYEKLAEIKIGSNKKIASEELWKKMFAQGKIFGDIY